VMGCDHGPTARILFVTYMRKIMNLIALKILYSYAYVRRDTLLFGRIDAS
jgi:hypothetical protein